MKRLIWNSDNGKYRVLVRHFEGDPGPLVDYWKLKPNGKKQSIRYKDLPNYVLEQIEIMKSQIMFK
ncbi:hypothetical protein [Bacillus sp. AFS040349]|uniref:hypothetical protein n=1 Tax=Bacillus sp. AFS040349 TaxID=2033502 RepID=UPI000BFC56FC|nr:hypothetical protein [Bacillus sp. AFS040349]PGT89195.1 hypothetical protein COD11_04125 [Bacillus sp. AFS040349]